VYKFPFVYERSDIIDEIILMVTAVAGQNARMVTRRSSLLSDVDLDSLRMLELIEGIRQRFGLDLLSPPHSLADLQTPETLADAILSSNPANAEARP